MDVALYFLANSYATFLPAFNTAAAVCKVNGKIVPCSYFFETFGSMLWVFFAFWLVVMFLVIFMFVALWKIFKKAGQPGWACLVPIYNLVVMLQIVHKPTWWVFFAFIPIVNIIAGLIIMNEFAKAFGKRASFTLGLIFLPFIFYPILGFGKSTYIHIQAAQN